MTKMFRTNRKDVPLVRGTEARRRLDRHAGAVPDRQEIRRRRPRRRLDRAQAGRQPRTHLHRNCDEFFIVLKGHGHIITDHGLEPSGEGDVVYSPRGCWHGFNNTSNEDVVLVWGWMGAGSIDASGYEVPKEGH